MKMFYEISVQISCSQYGKTSLECLLDFTPSWMPAGDEKTNLSRDKIERQDARQAAYVLVKQL